MEMEKVKDPVCGMEVDPKEVSLTSEYEGQAYYFCGPMCKKTFDADPAQHAHAMHHGHGDHDGHHHH